jgi:LacI family transcriptional regulator
MHNFGIPKLYRFVPGSVKLIIGAGFPVCIVTHMAVNMKQIARELGVSAITVSKALRSHPDISKKTRERVEAKAEELGYRLNFAARSLITGRSMLIGMIVPDLIHPFFSEIAKGMSIVLRDQGYLLAISSTEEDGVLEQQEINHLLAHRADAVVMASCQLNSEQLRLTRLSDTKLILVDRSFDDFPCHFVGSDDYACAKLATEHLISLKRKRIAHIRGPESSTGRRRLKGFLDTLKKHHIGFPPEYLFQARNPDIAGKQDGIEALKFPSALHRPPDAIWCYNDIIATGVIAQASVQGIRIPKDLIVIGCGNLHFDNEMRIPLSSIDQRSREIGQKTANLVLELLSKDRLAQGPMRKLILQPKLVVRASTDESWVAP